MEEKENHLSRRTFLAYLGVTAATAAIAFSGFGALTSKAFEIQQLGDIFKGSTGQLPRRFGSIPAIKSDQLELTNRLKHDILVAYEDRINKAGDTFGYHNGFTCFFPINDSSVHGLLWVSHATSPFNTQPASTINKFSGDLKKSLYDHGGSIIEVFRDETGKWKIHEDSMLARRITGTDIFEITGPALASKRVPGTLAEGIIGTHSGTKTPWGTILICEGKSNSTWESLGAPSTHYGWTAEVDPVDSNNTLKKHTALGRFNHGSATISISNSNHIVVHMSDFSTYGCLYKFISKGKFNSSLGKANSSLLTKGTLYAANIEKGTWIPLTLEGILKKLNDYAFSIPEILYLSREDLSEMFKEEADVFIHAQEAAILLGATPVGKTVDIKINPLDHSLYIAHPYNYETGNLHGHISRLIEQHSDFGSKTFLYDTFLLGGEQSKLSSPKQLLFDKSGHLYISTGIPSSKLNTSSWEKFKNNSLLLTSSDSPKRINQIASAPIEAEFAGAYFTPDEQTLFLSVQHPGEQTTNPGQPTSRWPHRIGDSIPRSALVAVTGF